MEEQSSEKTITQQQKKPFFLKFGLGLVAASFMLYGAILAVPFTPFDGKTKIIIGTTLAILGEVSFWTGGIILGKEVAARYKKYLNPLHWLRKKDD